MPTKSLFVRDVWRQLGYDETKSEVTGGVINLLPTDENGQFALGEGRKYRNSDVIEFPNTKIAGLLSFWSFEGYVGFNKDEDDVDLGTVEYQLSNDGGTTYLYWTGAAWATAGANDWNTENDVQDNIAAFTFPVGGDKQIRVKARLSPDSNQLSTPYLYGIAIHYELDFIPEEDVVRSLLTKLENELQVITEIGVVLAAAGTVIDVPFENKVLSVIGTWNNSTDPGRLANIFQSLSQTLVQTLETGEEIWSQQINITPSQAASSEILARLKLFMPIYIAPDQDYTIGKVPKVVMEIGAHAEDMDFRNDDWKYEKNKAKNKVRKRRQPTTYRMPIRLMSYSPDDLLAKEMNRALVRLLKDKTVLSLATGEELIVIEESEFDSANVVREGLSVKRFAFSIIYRDWPGDYQEDPLVETYQFLTDRGGMQ
jgi:hypothetical protein